VAHGDAQADVIRQLLQRHLPQADAVAVAPPGIGCDQQPLGLRVKRRTHLAPPAADRLGAEQGGVVVDAHAYPALIGRQVVHPRRRDLAQLLVQEVLGADFLGAACGLPFLPRVLEIPY